MADGTYNGWSNYETWLVNLWISNDQGTLEDAKAFLAGREYKSLAIKEYVEDIMCEDRPEGIMADLINAALGSINWHELATSLLED